MLTTIIAIASGYLFGSISFGYLLVRLIHKKDIRNVGNGAIGATNVVKNFGFPLGAVVGILDGLKGLIVVYFWYEVSGKEWIAILAGAATVLGHVLPVYLRFKGGKGQATAIGGLFFFLTKEFLLFFAIWFLLSLLTRKVYLSGTIATTCLPVFAIFFNQSIMIISLAVLMASLRWRAQISTFITDKRLKKI